MKVALAHHDADTIKLLRHVIAELGMDVIWDCSNSTDCVALYKKDIPNLLLLHLDLPGLPAKELVGNLMAIKHVSIVAISKSTKKIFEAMSAGALDAIADPAVDEPLTIEDLKRKIKNIRNLHKSVKIPHAPIHIKKGLPLIAIGSSTGGPAALVKVLEKFPSNFHAVVVIIQHVDKQFSAGMAKWISEQVHVRVEIARANQTPMPGAVYMAAGEDHLILKKDGHFDYTADPVDFPYRPSVDVFFESAITHWPNQMVGVLLTGMGRDGANGMLAFYNRGMHTIAQNEESCSVFGMPKAAIALGAAHEILHIDDIGNAINKTLHNLENKT